MHPLCKSCVHDHADCPNLTVHRGCTNWRPRDGMKDWVANILQDDDRHSAVKEIAVDIFGEEGRLATNTTSLVRNIMFTASDYILAAMLMDERFMGLLGRLVTERIDKLRRDCTSNDEIGVARDVIGFLVAYIRGEMTEGEFIAGR